jgi:hypothetical protein
MVRPISWTSAGSCTATSVSSGQQREEAGCQAGTYVGAAQGRQRHGRYLDRGNRARGALCAGLEQSDRLDLVACELDPHRVGVDAAEDVHDPAATGKIPRYVDGVAAQEAVLGQPADQGFGAEALSDGQVQAARADGTFAGHRLHQGQDRADDLGWCDLRPGGGLRFLDQSHAKAQALAGQFVGVERFAGQVLKLGQQLRRPTQQCFDIVAVIVGVFGVSGYQQQRAARALSYQCRHQRRATSPQALGRDYPPAGHPPGQLFHPRVVPHGGENVHRQGFYPIRSARRRAELSMRYGIWR